MLVGVSAPAPSRAGAVQSRRKTCVSKPSPRAGPGTSWGSAVSAPVLSVMTTARVSPTGPAYSSRPRGSTRWASAVIVLTVGSPTRLPRAPQLVTLAQAGSSRARPAGRPAPPSRPGGGGAPPGPPPPPPPGAPPRARRPGRPPRHRQGGPHERRAPASPPRRPAALELHEAQGVRRRGGVHGVLERVGDRGRQRPLDLGRRAAQGGGVGRGQAGLQGGEL